MRLIWLIFLVQSSLLGQKALILKPSGIDSQDTFIDSLNPNQNYGKSLDLLAMNWQQEGKQGITRMLLNFNLDRLPPDAEILLASISIYGKTSIEYGGNTVSGSANELLIKRVTSPWDDQTVTWNTKPSVTSANQVEVRSNIFIVEDVLNIDITQLIKDIISDKSGNFGLQVSLKTEVPHKRVVFNSSEISDEFGRPTLLILYEVPLSTDTCIMIRPNRGSATSTMVNNLYPDSILYPRPEISAIAEDDDLDNNYVEEAYFTFDYNDLHQNVKVNKVYLTLYANATVARQGHSVFSGPNHSTIRRVVEGWQAESMTWNNKPRITDINKVSLDRSAVFYQNYTNIDITDLFLDGYELGEETYGFHLSLDNEVPFRAMRFGSAHHEDANKRPQLLICYNPCEDEIDAITSVIETTIYEENISLPISYIGNIDRYEWRPMEGLSCYDCPNPKLTTQEIDKYTLTIANNIGCTKRIEVPLNFLPRPILVPNIIERNNPTNGTFYIQDTRDQPYTLVIYDRWGSQIFKTQAYTNEQDSGWSPSESLSPGVYIYHILLDDGRQLNGDVAVY